jgi:hypothetical protein
MGDTVIIAYLVTGIRMLVDSFTTDGDETALRLRGRGDRGAMTTEAVIIIAGLAALALAVVAIIVAKVTDKAKSIPTS